VGWTVTDYQVMTPGSIPFEPSGGGSIATVTFPAVPGGFLWRVERLSVQVTYYNNGPNTSVGTPVEVLAYDQAPTLPGSGIATGAVPATVPADQTVLELPVDINAEFGNAAGTVCDIADEGAPITVTEGNELTIVFVTRGAPITGSLASVRAQVQILGGVAGAPTAVAGASPPPAVPVGI
jgi:hypothetical protein